MNDLLHIYAQQWWHDEAYIVGNRAALQRLYDALGQALYGEEGMATFETFTSDGEGYKAYIHIVEDDAKWQRLHLPYAEEFAYDRRKHKDGLHPAQLEEKP